MQTDLAETRPGKEQSDDSGLVDVQALCCVQVRWRMFVMFSYVTEFVDSDFDNKITFSLSYTAYELLRCEFQVNLRQ